MSRAEVPRAALVGDGSGACPFCARLTTGVRAAAHSVAFEDAFPVSRGHYLVVPRRHVSSLFELERRELEDLLGLAAEVRESLLRSHHPDGFNLGVNEGTPAGQTIEHAHLHVIPRYEGDVADPRGGIRWVIPEAAPYWITE